jgi:hypothetical protein
VEVCQLLGHLYRIYLMGDAAPLKLRVYTAKDEAEAVEIATSVHATCSDVFSGYELWRGPQRIVPTQTNGAIRRENDPDIAALLKHQDLVLHLEDRLQKAFSCVSRSRKLVSLARQLRRHGSSDGSASCPRCRHAFARPLGVFQFLGQDRNSGIADLHALHHAEPHACGRNRVTTLPRPSVLSIITWPPMCRTKPRTWLSPRPLPFPISFVVKKGSNALASTSCAMPLPVPVSDTAMKAPGFASGLPASPAWSSI